MSKGNIFRAIGRHSAYHRIPPKQSAKILGSRSQGGVSKEVRDYSNMLQGIYGKAQKGKGVREAQELARNMGEEKFTDAVNFFKSPAGRRYLAEASGDTEFLGRIRMRKKASCCALEEYLRFAVSQLGRN